MPPAHRRRRDRPRRHLIDWAPGTVLGVAVVVFMVMAMLHG